MRIAATVFVSFAVASAAFAQMTPDVVVQKGDAFPIVADFNGDGLDDLIQERQVLLNDGVSLSTVRDLGLPAAEKVVAVLDVNGDRIPDLLTVQEPVWSPGGGVSGTYVYRLYIGDAARHYANGVEIASGGGPAPFVADVDGDGKDDIVIAKPVFVDHEEAAADVIVLRSRGDGTFDTLPAVRTPAAPQADDFRALVGDLNHDGLPDLIFRMPYDLVILRGTGHGKFVVESRYVPMALPGYGWWTTRLADIDGDGNLDIVTAGFRTIRVFLGDGHGNFPRMAVANVAQLHGLVGAPFLPEIVDPDHFNQPRDLAIGHFTRSDRNEIAAGTSEGDFVVFAYDNGTLSEVSRTSTEFWALAVRPGHFHRSALTDLYVMGTLIWGEMYPRPHIFVGTEGSSANRTTAPAALRRHRVITAPSATTTALQIQTHADCVADLSQRFLFVRDGVFGRAEAGQSTAEAVFDASIYLRISVPGVTKPVMVTLAPANGGYSGNFPVVTSCGVRTMTVTATP